MEERREREGDACEVSEERSCHRHSFNSRRPSKHSLLSFRVFDWGVVVFGKCQSRNLPPFFSDSCLLPCAAHSSFSSNSSDPWHPPAAPPRSVTPYPSSSQLAARIHTLPHLTHPIRFRVHHPFLCHPVFDLRWVGNTCLHPSVHLFSSVHARHHPHSRWPA